MSKNKLLYGIKKASLTGSKKTQYNNKAQAMRFAKTLHKQGFRPQHWKNITNKHVGIVVDEWKQQGLKPSTIKAYLGSVRAITRAYGNESIHKENAEFGVKKRTTVAIQSHAVPEATYRKVREALLRGNEREQRIGHQITVMHNLGLRAEEARKLNPATALLPDGRIYISAGTKGGRDRIIQQPTPEQIASVNALQHYIGKNGNSWPDDVSEANWEKYTYKKVSALGLSKSACGASLHGLRHGYAQHRYHQLTKLNAPCLHPSPKEFRQAAVATHGSDWRKVHNQAVVILAHELGHNRGEITACYIGSIHG